MEIKKYLNISGEVQEALAKGKPVVALESTIISHGFTYPANLECARTSESSIRENGAIPATIAILNGEICVGLKDRQLQMLAGNREIPKCSRRDVAALIAKQSNGATTVATTMLFAAMAGIKVFATGGIGGVHRFGNETFDISADLQELAQTNIAVVCAGCKSILDIPKTREYLETFGVPVLGYQTNDFPGFYTKKSGVSVDYRMQTVKEIAKVIKVKSALGLKGGIIIANPIPDENEMDYDYITTKIEESQDRALKAGISGKDITPFILDDLHSITDGKSIEANQALVFNNAALAAKIAVELINC